MQNTPEIDSPPRLSARPTIVAAFVVIALAFAGNAWVHLRTAQTLERNEELVANSQGALTAIESLLSTANDAETGQRGFLITGEREYLQPYEEATARIDREIAKVRELLADDPGQLARLDRATELVRVRFEVLKQTITARESMGDEAARAMVRSGTGKAYMDALRGVIAEMMVEEERLLDERTANIRAGRRQTRWSLAAASLTGFVLLGVVFWFLHRHLASLIREREAGETIHNEQAKLQGIIDSAMDAIISVNENQKIVVFNSAAEKIFGWSAADAFGQPLDRFLPERYRHAHHDHVQNFGASGVTKRSMNSPGILSGLRSNGEEFPIEATISQVNVGGQKLYSVILRDISERKRTEEQLQQAQKLEAIGRLAGGVAHDFNNLLGIILGYSELLLNNMPEQDYRREWLQQMEKSAHTGALLTRQLLAFSRKQTIAPEYMDLARTVSEMEPMLRRLLREDIELMVHTTDGSCPVKADPGHVQQLVMNLVANARDALPGEGTITIEVRTVELDAAYAQQHRSVVPGHYVMLAVSDTGVGMSPEVAAKIFEPFFTTKPTGKGTGLGLATVFGIVKQNDGDIWVYSEPGVGTIFKVYLPRRAEVVEVSRPAKPHLDALEGDETLLLVEDSVALRQLTREILVRAGYHVLEAEDGVHALEVSRTYDGQIDGLLTDIVMPRMRGTEVAKKIAEVRPEIRVVFMSGYSEEALSNNVDGDRLTILEKPYTGESLLRTVREALDGVDPRMTQSR